jgi:hypothetical protein
VIAVLAAVVVSSLATWFANQLIRSPAEAAAQSGPPEPAPILVPVVEQELATKIVTRGTGRYGAPRQLSVTPSALKSSAGVVTSVQGAGSTVDEGDVLLTISGRPVFLLQGTQPSFRDLGPGMSGQDVRQLERALERVGFDPGPIDGLYDAGTESAVTALYGRKGFQPVVATEAQLAAARPREADLVQGWRAESGVQFPADEVVFVRDIPVRITELLAKVGTRAEGALVTVTDPDVVIEGVIPIEQADLVEEGAPVVFDEEALGIEGSARVSHIADGPGTEGADAFHLAFEVAVKDPPQGLIGASVRLTVPIESTKGAELTVPLSAVSLGPDGGSRVQRSAGGGFHFVPVVTGLSADGYVTVTPREGRLEPGDLVVVGFEG